MPLATPTIVLVAVESLVALSPLRCGLIERVLLPELLLRRCDQAEIVLGVLVVIFGRDRVAGALRVARKLDVFLGDVMSGSADLHVGAIRLIDPRQRIVMVAAAATAPPPPLW